MPYAQAIGQRCVDQHGFAAQIGGLFTVALGAAQLRQLPGQGDQHHAHVLHQRQQQPAQALGAAPGPRRDVLGLDLLQFQQTGQLRRHAGRQPAFPAGGLLAMHLRHEEHGAANGARVRRKPLQDIQEILEQFQRLARVQGPIQQPLEHLQANVRIHASRGVIFVQPGTQGVLLFLRCRHQASIPHASSSRLGETFSAVPSCWAKTDTPYSCSNHRKRSRASSYARPDSSADRYRAQ